MVKTCDHIEAIVIVNVHTNNLRRGHSLYNIRGYQETIIWMLKEETSPQNIIFVDSPVSKVFQTHSFNTQTLDLCKREQVGFSHCSLIKKPHLKEDGYHIQRGYQHLVAKTVAGAILKASHGI